MNQRDEADAGISNLVFDVNNKERPPWRCCSNSTVPRSEVIFFCSSEYHCLNDHSLLLYAFSTWIYALSISKLDCSLIEFSWLHFT